MKLANIEYAPVNVPMKRRIQTLATAAWFAIMVLGIPLSICFIIATFLWAPQWMKLVLLIYFAFIYYDRNTARRGGRSFGMDWIRAVPAWIHYVNYFPVKLIKTAEIDPKKNYMFCSFPHGLLATGAAAAFNTNALKCNELFPGLEFRTMTLDQHFYIPFFREFLLTMGACSCSESSLDYLLSTKPKKSFTNTKKYESRAVVLVIGGAAEAFRCKPGTYTILLRRRKGFVRMALKHGSPLVPVFSFGETDLYDQVENPQGSLLRSVQEFIKSKCGVAPVIPIGRGFFQYSFGLIPNRRPVTVVVGKPLEVPKISEPSDEEINKYHEQFTESLVNLFESHKSKYLANYEDISLLLE